jgi:hypothetical protein
MRSFHSNEESNLMVILWHMIAIVSREVEDHGENWKNLFDGLDP